MVILADIVFDKIKTIIFSGEYAPNARINIDDLAKKCECSKTPIREALKKLNAEGFVYYEPKKGFRTKYLSLPDYIKKYEIQEMFEIYLVKKMASMPLCVDVDKLQAINDNIMDFRTQKNFSQIPEENEKFHCTLYENYHNDFMLNELKKIWSEVKMQRNLMSFYAPFVYSIVEEHNNILKAISENDPIKAEEAMVQHYKSGREAILFHQKW